MAITLPKAPIKPTSENPSSLLLYGLEKVGKTQFASELPGALIIDLENGSKFIEAMKMQVSDLKQLQEIGEAIMNEGRPYKYIFIDTITELEDWLEWEATIDYMGSLQGKRYNRVTEEMGWRPKGPKDEPPTLPREQWKSVLSLPDGAGYMWLRLAFKRWDGKLKKLAEHIIYLGHMRDKIDTKDGITVTAKELDLTGKLRRMACQSADAVGYMFRGKDNQLKISFMHNEELAVGTRCPHLKGTIIDADWKNIFI